MYLLVQELCFKSHLDFYIRELFGENVCKEVEEELNENCIFYHTLYKNLSLLFHLLLPSNLFLLSLITYVSNLSPHRFTTA